MSIPALRWAAPLPLKGATKAVLLALADMVADGTNEWEPSLERLSLWSGLPRRSLIRAIQRLEEEGLLAVRRATGKRSKYELRVGAELNQCHSGTGAKTAPVSDWHGTSATVAPQPVPPWHPTLPVLPSTPSNARADVNAPPMSMPLKPAHPEAPGESGPDLLPTSNETATKMLAEKGALILRRVCGWSMPKCREAVDLLVNELGGDRRAAFAVLCAAARERPGRDELAVWFSAAIEKHRPRAAKPEVPIGRVGPSRFDNLPGVVEENGHPTVNGWHIDLIWDRVAEAAGIDAERWTGNVGPLAHWLKDGIDPHETVLPAIRRIASRPSYAPPRSLRYFDAAVREQVSEARIAP
ncbi:MAG TPA: helix-turn-helix domain-containing protein [Acetobacteraceae bacterium]|nr:helix-turn-helix domain-containing protein [Acetobacteraceae bacterium]